jgi:hypothetical protein
MSADVVPEPSAFKILTALVSAFLATPYVLELTIPEVTKLKKLVIAYFI